jgi:hypothetical protein
MPSLWKDQDPPMPGLLYAPDVPSLPDHPRPVPHSGARSHGQTAD